MIYNAIVLTIIFRGNKLKFVMRAQMSRTLSRHVIGDGRWRDADLPFKIAAAMALRDIVNIWFEGSQHRLSSTSCQPRRSVAADDGQGCCEPPDGQANAAADE